MNKASVITTSMALLVMAAIAYWWFGSADVDPQVAKIEAMAQQLFTENSNQSSEDRRSAWREVREAAEQLSPEQRQQLRARREQEFTRRMNAHLKEFFSLSPQDQMKEVESRSGAVV